MDMWVTEIMKHWNSSNLAFLAAIFVAGAALWAKREAVQKDAEKSRAAAAFQSELRERSDEIAKLNGRIANLVTGGNSFCYFTPILGNGPVPVTWAIAINGDFPLYDVTAEITDLQKANALGNNPTFAEMMATKSSVVIGSLPPGVARNIGNIFPPSGSYRSFKVHFFARNGGLAETIKMKLVDGKWLTAICVIRMSDGEVLLEQIPAGFPVSPDGKVNWAVE